MKEIKGYLIDRATGAGISGKTVRFEDLSGSPITTGTHGTIYQEQDSLTQSDGSFRFMCELSPGPVQVEVDVGASEFKRRKWDEQAQFGYRWSSDISRIGRGLGNGVVKGFLSELALQADAGNNFRVQKGAAVIAGAVWSLENLGGLGHHVFSTSANLVGSGINPRLDLVSLKQYHEDAAGQLAGKQELVVTLGTTSNVLPPVPTGADFTALPIGALTTPEGGSTSIYTTHPYPAFAGQRSAPVIHRVGDLPAADTAIPLNDNPGVPPSPGSLLTQAFAIGNLDPSVTYDGWAEISSYATFSTGAGTALLLSYLLDSSAAPSPDLFTRRLVFTSVAGGDQIDVSFRVPLIGITGSPSHTVTLYAWYTLNSGSVSEAKIGSSAKSIFSAYLSPR